MAMARERRSFTGATLPDPARLKLLADTSALVRADGLAMTR